MCRKIFSFPLAKTFYMCVFELVMVRFFALKLVTEYVKPIPSSYVFVSDIS